jgi:hypothetical protein
MTMEAGEAIAKIAVAMRHHAAIAGRSCLSQRIFMTAYTRQ